MISPSPDDNGAIKAEKGTEETRMPSIMHAGETRRECIGTASQSI
jgi:hypothetical protein